MYTNENDSATDLLKAFNSSIKSGLSVEAAAKIYLNSSKVSTDGRILILGQVAGQETPASAALLLDVLCDSKQPAAMHDHCLRLLRGMKNTYDVLCEINAHYRKLQGQMNDINFGRQKGSLMEVNSNLCCMQKLMCDLNSVKLPLRSADTSKIQATARSVPVH